MTDSNPSHFFETGALLVDGERVATVTDVDISITTEDTDA